MIHFSSFQHAISTPQFSGLHVLHSSKQSAESMRTALKESFDSFTRGQDLNGTQSEPLVYSLQDGRAGNNLVIITDPGEVRDSLFLGKALDMQRTDPNLTYRYASDQWSDHAPAVLRRIQLNIEG